MDPKSPQAPYLALHVTNDCLDDDGKVIVQAGSTVKYVAHVPLGMVRVRCEDGREEIIHPHATREFRN